MVRGWRIEAVRFHRRERREWGQVLRACCPNGVEARSRRDRRRRVLDADRRLQQPGVGSMTHPGATAAPTARTTAHDARQNVKTL